MKKLRYFLTLLVALLIPASFAFAQTIKIVPCEGDGCRACDLVTLADNIINFLIMISLLIAAILFAYAGFLMVTSGGNSGKVKKAKEVFQNVLIGIVIVLSGWIIINTIMSILVGENLFGGSWRSIQCVPNGTITAGSPQQGASEPQPQPGDQNYGGPVTPVGGTLSQSEAQTRLTAAGITINGNVQMDGVNQDLTNTLVGVRTETGLDMVVTAAKNGVHQNSCHAAGTCFDVVCTTCGMDSQKLNTFIQSTQAKGYCAVFEPGPSGSCPAGVRPCLGNVGTGAHFSFYMTPGQSGSCSM